MSTLHLIFVEGETDFIFFQKTKEKWFKSKHTNIIRLKGNSNITDKVLEKIESKTIDKIFTGDFTNLALSICVDRDSRNGLAPVNIPLLKKEISRHQYKVNSLELYEAVQDIESWFFYDIEGLYKMLRVANSIRNPSKYRPAERNNHKTLSKLFRDNGKNYVKGEKCESIITCIDLEVIYNNCQTYKNFITRAQNIN